MRLAAYYAPFKLSPEGLHRFDAPMSCGAVWLRDSPGGTKDDVIRAEIDRAEAWLRQHKKTNDINKSVTSYALKHEAEAHARKVGHENYYISNGAFLMAAHNLGFRIGPVPAPEAMIAVNWDWQQDGRQHYVPYIARINISSRKLWKPGT